MAGFVLGAALAAHVLLDMLARRHAGRLQAAGGGALGESALRHWIGRGIFTSLRPLAWLLWILALHLALAGVMNAARGGALADRAMPVLDWLRGVGVIAGVVWLLARWGRVIEAAIVAFAARSEAAWDDLFAPLFGRAVRRLTPLIALILASPALAVSAELETVFRNAVSLVLIGGVAFVLFELLNAAEAVVLQQYRIDVADNLEARKIHTQVRVLKKVAVVVIGIVTLASVLMVFEPVRQLGTSILASAGIAGIIVGLAAQRSIATLLAGFQIAITQPIRIDDVVIVEGEWGQVEDITLTFVVVRIWDLRRLVVPITYFIERPFENWTRRSADILGTVFLHVDYTVPVQEIRDELNRILSVSPRWDGRVNVLQVTAVRERTLELRALASARDASQAWDLRCEVREKLIDFIRRRHPDSLPQVRVAASVERSAAVVS
jgi:small-conductance mechanosensitive channel